MVYELHSTGSYYFFVSLIVPNQAPVFSLPGYHISSSGASCDYKEPGCIYLWNPVTEAWSQSIFVWEITVFLWRPNLIAQVNTFSGVGERHRISTISLDVWKKKDWLPSFSSFALLCRLLLLCFRPRPVMAGSYFPTSLFSLWVEQTLAA